MNIKASSQFGVSKKRANSHAFTIVELLVVIVVIGILAAITIVSYTGITQKATVASLNSDLDNASKLLRMFNVSNSTYPTTISTNCTTNPDTTTNKCLSFSTGTAYSYKVSPTDNRIFCLDVTKNSTSYNVTQEGQLLAGPCPVFNLDAGNTLSYAGTGTIWKDLSGNDYNGTLNNGVAYSSVNGGVMNFDGVDDYAVITAPVAPLIFTVESWIYENALNREQHFAEFNGTQFYVSSSNKLGTSSWSNATGSTTININTWYHVACVRDGNSVLLYVNGVLNSNNGTLGANPLVNFYIGNFYSLTGNYDFNGLVSNVRVYDKALSASDILYNYKSTKVRYGL